MRTALAGLAATAVLSTAGCGGNSGSSADTTSPSAGAGGTGAASSSAVSGNITVFAAASLTESFTQIGKDFEAANPQAKATFSFAASSALAMQINQGAKADVFASAAPANMKTVTDAGMTSQAPTVFVRNQLVIAVSPGNPKHLAGLADLGRPGVKVALCAAAVPCGAAAKTALKTAGVNLKPVTLEQDVKSALSKVELGEVDAALVYRTDARSASGKVEAVEFPESASAINDYPIAALKDAPNPDAARAFVAFILSAPARNVMAQAGFQAP